MYEAQMLNFESFGSAEICVVFSDNEFVDFLWSRMIYKVLSKERNYN
jgi:hypothetical protein